MRCFIDYRNDRVCDLCSLYQPITHDRCKELHKVKKNCEDFLLAVERSCPYRIVNTQSKASATVPQAPITTCNRNGRGYGVYADPCNCGLQCYKFSDVYLTLEAILCSKCKNIARWDESKEKFVCEECSWESPRYIVINKPLYMIEKVNGVRRVRT